MRWTKWGMTAAIAGGLVVSAAGCGDGDVTGPDQGTVEAVIVDEGESSEALRDDRLIGFQTSESVSGEFRGTARLQLFVNGEWQDVTGLSNVNVATHLRAAETTWGSAGVSARTYDRARIVLTGAEAELDAGSDLGAGPIEASVTLSINGGAEVEVEIEAPVTVHANATTRVMLDLRSHMWLNETSLQAGTVSKEAFEAAALLQASSF